MKSVIRYAAFAAVTALLLGCSGEAGVEDLFSLRRSSVGYAAGDMFLSIQSSGEWSISFEYEEGDGEWLSVSRSSGTGSTNSVILQYGANLQEESRSAYVIVNFEDKSLRARLLQRGRSSMYNGGEGYQIPSWEEYPGLVSDVTRGWTELPQMKDIEGTAWVYHNLKLNDGKEFRNYSILYDASRLFPRWVAYPLTKPLAGSGNRTNKWEQTDPKIPAEYQPYTQAGWGQSGFDRGHMLPSADRLINDAANWQTFYPTNMTMQRSDLNQGVWALLESQVRAWAMTCDTLYVVTGAMPSEEWRTDRAKNKVNVPSAYYKALLRYKASDSHQYSGIAFWYDNVDYPMDRQILQSDVLTIAQLEERTGFNFFFNLTEEEAEYAEKTLSPAMKF